MRLVENGYLTIIYMHKILLYIKFS